MRADSSQPSGGREGAENHSWRVIEERRLHLCAAAPSRSSNTFMASCAGLNPPQGDNVMSMYQREESA